MKKSLDKIIIETWNIFADNIILLIPAVMITLMNIIVYGVLAIVIFTLCIKDFLSFGYNLRNPSTLPYSEILGYFTQFILYIVCIIVIALTYSFIIGVLHRSGWGYMHAKAVSTGNTNIGDYFEGIAKFSSRMFWLVSVKVSILWIPPLLLLVVAAIASSAVDVSEAPAAFLVVIMGGAVFVMIIEVIIWFYTWMWRPSMFIRDISVMDSLFEGISFTNKHIGMLLLFALLWISLMFALGIFFGVFNTVAQIFMEDPGNSLKSVGAFLLVFFAIVRWTILLFMRIIFSLFYYRYYFEETTGPDTYYSEPAFPSPYSLTVPTVTGHEPDSLDHPHPFRDLPAPWEPPGDVPDLQGEINNSDNVNMDSDDPDRPEDEPLPPGFC